MKKKIILPIIVTSSIVTMLVTTSCNTKPASSDPEYESHADVKVNFDDKTIEEGQTVSASIEVIEHSENAYASVTGMALSADKKSATVDVDLIRTDNLPSQNGDTVKYKVNITCTSSVTNEVIWNKKSNEQTLSCSKKSDSSTLENETEWRAAWSNIDTPSNNRNVSVKILDEGYKTESYYAEMDGKKSYLNDGEEKFTYLDDENIIWLIDKTSPKSSVASPYDVAAATACMWINSDVYYKYTDFKYDEKSCTYAWTNNTEDEKIFVKFNNKKVSSIQRISVEPQGMASNSFFKFSYGKSKIENFPTGDKHQYIDSKFEYVDSIKGLKGETTSMSQLWDTDLQQFTNYDSNKDIYLTMPSYTFSKLTCVWKNGIKLTLGDNYWLEDESTAGSGAYNRIKIKSGLFTKQDHLKFLNDIAGTPCSGSLIIKQSTAI